MPPQCPGRRLSGDFGRAPRWGSSLHYGPSFRPRRSLYVTSRKPTRARPPPRREQGAGWRPRACLGFRERRDERAGGFAAGGAGASRPPPLERSHRRSGRQHARRCGSLEAPTASRIADRHDALVVSELRRSAGAHEAPPALAALVVAPAQRARSARSAARETAASAIS
jgi:hypothetical protein